MALSKISRGLTAIFMAAPVFGQGITLWATSYNDGMVSTLKFDGGVLTKTAQNAGCGPQPTWLTLDKKGNVLYCLDEGWNDNPLGADLTSFSPNADGTLTLLDHKAILKSPVSSTLYGNGRLAIAHYDTGSFTSWDISNPKNITKLQEQKFTPPSPGPAPQDIAHLHDAILDPTGKFLVSPDLGSDLIRIFATSPRDGKFVAIEPATATKGSGPRHGAFVKHGANTFFYTVNELGNSITGYKVSYGKRDCSLSLTKFFDVPQHGAGTTVPAGTSAAELEISPDGRFVLTSSRNEKSLTIPAYDGSNTTIPSDPILVHQIDPLTGELTFVQAAPAGGVNPRGFSLNKAGTLVAVGLQTDNRVAIIERDVVTGKLGKILAQTAVGNGLDANGPNYVLFDE